MADKQSEISRKTPMGNTIHQIESSTASHTVTFLDNLKTRTTNSETTRWVHYLLINPLLQPSPFLRWNLPIFEQNRIATNQLRLSSHHLRIETGWWSRTPLEQKTCTCQNGIQSEEHVLTTCRLSQHLQDSYYPNHYMSFFITMTTKNSIK